jgi:hypothetical protein
MIKRSLSDFTNKNEFPFSINNNQLSYPKIYSKINSSNKTRFWYIYAYLKSNNTKIGLTEDLIELSKFKKLEEEYSNLKMYIYTKYGLTDGKITKTEPTIIDIGKNINKSNETSIFTQSLIYMRNLYLKKLKSGYNLEYNDINTNTIYPMALHVYEKNKKHIEYPCYIQPKLDGVRVITQYNNDTYKLLSRRLNEYIGFESIIDEIKILLHDNPNIILDGELYNHKLSLQEISGIVRNENLENNNKDNIKFYIFDIIDNTLSFQERYKILVDLFKNHNFKYLTLLETELVHNEKESNELYEYYITNNYEGIIYKNKNALYESSNIKEKRSYQFLKRKKQYDAEYKIIDFTSGEHGKDKDCIIFILETEDKKQFKAVPNMTLKERKHLYQKAKENFNRLYKNKYATIKFDEYSNEQVPLRAKFITIRDYE